MGDQVWVIRPKGITGPKTETWWTGPAKVVERVGEASYVVEFGPGDRLDVHQDQLKRYHANEPVGEGVPLVYHVDYTRQKGPLPTKIRAHRVVGGRKLELLVHWEGTKILNRRCRA